MGVRQQTFLFNQSCKLVHTHWERSQCHSKVNFLSIFLLLVCIYSLQTRWAPRSLCISLYIKTITVIQTFYIYMYIYKTLVLYIDTLDFMYLTFVSLMENRTNIFKHIASLPFPKYGIFISEGAIISCQSWGNWSPDRWSDWSQVANQVRAWSSLESFSRSFLHPVPHPTSVR